MNNHIISPIQEIENPPEESVRKHGSKYEPVFDRLANLEVEKGITFKINDPNVRVSMQRIIHRYVPEKEFDFTVRKIAEQVWQLSIFRTA